MDVKRTKTSANANYLWIVIREMVSFELGKEIENDIFFVFSRAWDKEKILSLSHACDKISLLSSKLIISLIIIYKHYAIDIADPSSMQDACDMNFVTDSLTVESLWLSGRASERGIRRSEVRFLMRTLYFLSVPRSWQDEKNIILYKLLHLKLLRSHLSSLNNI